MEIEYKRKKGAEANAVIHNFKINFSFSILESQKLNCSGHRVKATTNAREARI